MTCPEYAGHLRQLNAFTLKQDEQVINQVSCFLQLLVPVPGSGREREFQRFFANLLGDALVARGNKPGRITCIRMFDHAFSNDRCEFCEETDF